MKKPKSIASLLSARNGALGKTLKHSRHLLQLEHGIKALLPTEIAPHCRLANVQDDVLTLAVTSNVWASRLRYQLPQLLRQLKRHRRFHHLKEIRLVVLPESRQRHRQRPPLKLTLKSAEVINSAASSIDDKRLSAALRKLVRHAKR